jgi:hypothetical protein
MIEKNYIILYYISLNRRLAVILVLLMFVEELLSLVTLQIYLAKIAELLRHEKDIYLTKLHS